MKVSSSGNTSHTIDSGLGSRCSRTNTPRTERNEERTEEIGSRRQQSKRVFVDVPKRHWGNRELGTNRGAVLTYRGEKFRPVVSLDHDYSRTHRGRSMTSEDTKVSTAEHTNINRDISDQSHRFRRVDPSGKSPMVSPVKLDVKRSDKSDNVMYYGSKGNHKVSSSSQIAPIQINVKEELSTGGVCSNIYPDPYIPRRSTREWCKGSESLEEKRFGWGVVPEDTTTNKYFSREKRQISDRKNGMSHTQPFHTYQYRGNTADRIETNGVDDTGYDYNERVSPHSTEHFYGTPIRYNRADVRKPGWEGVTPGRKVVKLNDHDGRWMSKPTNEEGNSWYRNGYDSRFSHTIGKMGQSREGDWVSEHTSKPDRTDHRVAGDTNGERHIL